MVWFSLTPSGHVLNGIPLFSAVRFRLQDCRVNAGVANESHNRLKDELYSSGNPAFIENGVTSHFRRARHS